MDWTISNDQRKQFREVFNSLATNLIVTAEIVKEKFDSFLPASDLFEIWKLSDLDEDGALNEKEFMLFQYLVHTRLIPSELPNEIQFHTLLFSIENPEPQEEQNSLPFLPRDTNNTPFFNPIEDLPFLPDGEEPLHYPPRSSIPPNENPSTSSDFQLEQDATSSTKNLSNKSNINSGEIDSLFELPPITPILPWESYRITIPPMTTEDYALYGLTDTPIPRHDIAPETIKVGLITTIPQAQQFLTEYEKVFQQFHKELEEQGKIHKNMIEKGPLLHSEFLNIEQQALQCHNYISHQFKECMLAEAKLKEAKGNLHALLHIANQPVTEKSQSDDEYHQLFKEKERLSRLLQMIDT